MPRPDLRAFVLASLGVLLAACSGAEEERAPEEVPVVA
jgi:hypothetical protein